MFDYTHRLQLAVKDTARRGVVKLIAAIFLLMGAGFLISAFWYWLAFELAWGAAMASLCTGVGLNLIGIALLLVSGNTRHAMPTTHELKSEIDSRVSLAADAASRRAKAELQQAVNQTESKLLSFVSGFGGRTRKTFGTASRTQRKVATASSGKNGNLIKLFGAFAVGIALATQMRGDNDPDES